MYECIYYFGEQFFQDKTGIKYKSDTNTVLQLKRWFYSMGLIAPWFEPVVPACIVGGCVGLAFRIP